MKLVLLSLLTLVSCSDTTEFGKCVGISEKQDPTLEYKPSARNIIVGTIFFQIVVPPIIVLTSEFYCPIGKKENK